MSIIRKLERALKRDGVLGTLVLCARNLRPVRRDGSRSQFDAAYDVDTDGRIELGDLKVQSPSDIWGTAYDPTPPRVFDKVLAILPQWSEYSVVDLGCGKGRVVLMASSKPFKAVIGVEFAPELCAIAEANVARFKPHIQAADVRIVCEDAALFEFPPGPLIVYFYYAFTRNILAGIVQRLSQRQDETIFVFYNVHDKDLFESFPLIYSENNLSIWRITYSAALRP